MTHLVPRFAVLQAMDNHSDRSGGVTMKYFLYLAAAAGFLPILIIRAKLASVPYNTLLTELATVQEEILTVHNTLRRGVVPLASNMLKMNWSEEAAQNARVLSKQCELRESSSLKRRITNTFCGENMHMTTYPISWSNVIKIWYNESKYFKYGEWTPMDSDIEHYTQHYTQVVWATSYLIGCGISSCPKRKLTQYLYICHYCHEGNDPAKRNEPYNAGSPCGDCPNDCENKLCTNPCLYYDEYSNCQIQKRSFGCSPQSVQQFCKASCLCDKKIK
ncbi:cysteine-rich secretory protein 1 [Canis lupus dingo]|uniref:cysteine-rich secretory protein 1 n=1 Tax=Canis lupus dingo TaxID=286419 RepID=UPI00005A2772|nr:cysteine-rich secretory protein 1 [Canis lupus dingo]|eukprot:XP_003639479.2 cysteine-rich secretory protein 1 [Canis lupus familiaris]